MEVETIRRDGILEIHFSELHSSDLQIEFSLVDLFGVILESYLMVSRKKNFDSK